MKAERRKPCGNCPFRRSAPLAYWDPREYLMLQRSAAVEGETGVPQGPSDEPVVRQGPSRYV